MTNEGLDPRYDGEITDDVKPPKLEDMTPAQIKKMSPQLWFGKLEAMIKKDHGETDEAKRLIQAARQKRVRIEKSMEQEKTEKKAARQTVDIDLPAMVFDPEWLRDLPELEQNVLRLHLSNKYEPGEIAEKLKSDYPDVTRQLVVAILRRDDVEAIVKRVRDFTLNNEFWAAVKIGLKEGNPQIMKMVSEMGIIKNADDKNQPNCSCHENGCIAIKKLENPELTKLLIELGSKLD